jgi:hypothetical protein
MMIFRKRAIDDFGAQRANDLGDHACDCALVQRDRTVGKAQEAMIKPKEASGAFRFALSADIGSWRVQRNEQCEHRATKTLVEGQIAADRNYLVIGMGRHNEYALFLDCSQLDRHAVCDAVNAPKETRRRALKYAVQKWRSLHLQYGPIRRAPPWLPSSCSVTDAPKYGISISRGAELLALSATSSRACGAL